MTEHAVNTESPAMTDGQSPSTRRGSVPRPPWIVLVSGYLICSGSVFVLAMLLAQFTEYNILWVARFYGEDHDWSNLQTWFRYFQYFRLIPVPVLMLAAGVVVYRRPASLRFLALPVTIAVLLPAAGETVRLVVQGTQTKLPFPFWFSYTIALRHLSSAAVPVFVVLYVGRALNRRRPEIDLITGYLLIVGGLGTLAFAVQCLGSGWRGIESMVFPRLGWTLGQVSHTIWRLAPIVFLLCGLLLLKRPARVVVVGVAVLVVTALHSILQVVTFPAALVQVDSVLRKICMYLREPVHPVVLALFLLVFAIKFRHLFGPEYPACLKCGYNLTGLTEARCPECGKPFEQAASAERNNDGTDRGATKI